MRWDGGNGRTKCELQQKEVTRGKEQVRRSREHFFFFILLGGRKDKERKDLVFSRSSLSLSHSMAFLPFFLCVCGMCVRELVCERGRGRECVCGVCVVCLSSAINTLWLADHLYHRGPWNCLG